MVKTTKNRIVYEENINNIEGKAMAIVFPETTQELKNLVTLSHHDIIPRGNGTSFTGAVIPSNSVIVDFSKMNKIIDIDSSKRIAVVEPGVLLSELNEELENYDLEFPVIPLFSGIETIGGMIAKNSAGNREIKYGRMITWIDSLEAINGRGEQIKVSKSDLSDFVGMEGASGMIIQATLRLTNRKKRSFTILKATSLQDVFIANRKLRLKQDTSSIDLINPDISSLLGLENKYHIFVELESNDGSFKEHDYEKFAKLKDKCYKKIASEGFIYMSNVKLLIDSLQDFLIYLEERKIPYFAHLASGVVYPFFKPEQIQELQEAMKFAKRVRAKIAYNFGIGLTKKDALELGEADLIRRVKNRLDPNGKFNRDKLVDFKPYRRHKIEEKPAEKKKTEENKEIEEKPAEEQKSEQTADIEKTTQEQTPVQEQIPNPETTTLKKSEEQISPEEREKIKKIAAGFFAGGRKSEENTQ